MMKVFEQPSFTKFKSIESLRDAFRKAPKQIAGSPEAFEGLVAEFKDPETNKTFTCSEINDIFKYKNFLVKLLNGNIITIINNSGIFFIKG
jgi:hypothetical protein